MSVPEPKFSVGEVVMVRIPPDFIESGYKNRDSATVEDISHFEKQGNVYTLEDGELYMEYVLRKRPDNTPADDEFIQDFKRMLGKVEQGEKA